MIISKCNGSWLQQGPDGREAWIHFRADGSVAICTDIHNQGPPHTAVLFTPEMLRGIADEAERRIEGR
jgi:hypothetical protein